MPISADEVSRLGTSTVAQSSSEVGRKGKQLFPTSVLTEIVRRAHPVKENRLASKEALFEYSRALLQQAETSAALFIALPAQPVQIRPLPDYLESSGVSSHYEYNPDLSGTSTFWIALDDWKDQTRASAAITVMHETFRGHHLQAGIARMFSKRTPISGLLPSAPYIEGWANYAEQLAEEAHIDDDDYERIQRRLIFGRSLVIDPGVNAFGWSREKALQYAIAAGLSHRTAEDPVDRIAVEPAQLTSYELGGLENSPTPRSRTGGEHIQAPGRRKIEDLVFSPPGRDISAWFSKLRLRFSPLRLEFVSDV